MAELGVGIVGSGFMGRTHAEAISRYIPGARLVAVTGGSRAPALAAEYGADLVPSLEALLARGDVDALILASPHHLHGPQAIAAAEAGKHVLVEKPMATSTAECDRLLAACQRAGVKLMVAQTQRFRTGNLVARELITTGRIGEVLMMRDCQVAAGGAASLPSWNHDDLGTIAGHAIHNIDRVRWFTGSEVASVYATARSYTRAEGPELSAMLQLEMQTGAMAQVWISFETPRPGFQGRGFYCEVTGSAGMLEVDSYSEVRLGTPEGWETVHRQPPIDFKGNPLSPHRMESFARQDQAFVDAVRQDREPPVSGLEGRAAVAVAEAAYRSLKSGRAERPL